MGRVIYITLGIIAAVCMASENLTAATISFAAFGVAALTVEISKAVKSLKKRTIN